jgi:predicted deacylase
VSNPSAFWNGTRTSPLDGGNLARVFPGDSKGGPTTAIAHALAQDVISHADFFLDLHSAGVRWLMPTMVGFDSHDARGREAALCFGAPVIWGHPVLAPGRTISFAHERGIPWLYTEARGAGRIDPEDLRVFREGIFNLLRHLEVIPGEPASPERIEWRLHGDGNLEDGLLSTKAGFFVSDVELLEQVSPDQRLGKTLDLHGDMIEEFRATSSGVIAMLRQFPMVEPGEPMFVITGIEE